MARRRRAIRVVLGGVGTALVLAGCGPGADIVALDAAPDGNANATATAAPTAAAGLTTAAPDPELEAQLQTDLSRWADFPVDADPRPLILLRPVQDDPEGFSNGTTKDDFAYGRWANPRDLPDAPAEMGGYPIMGAAEALDALRRAEGDGVQAGRSELTVKDVWLDETDVDTDRGVRRLPAWFVTFDNARGESIIPAVAKSARWTGAEGGPSSRSMTVHVDPSGRVLTLPYDQSEVDPCDKFVWRTYVRESAQAVVIRLAQEARPTLLTLADEPVCPDYVELTGRGAKAGTSEIDLTAPLGNRLVMWEGDPVEVLPGPKAEHF